MIGGFAMGGGREEEKETQMKIDEGWEKNAKKKNRNTAAKKFPNAENE